MMATINGYKFFLSAEEQKRIREKSKNDLLKRLIDTAEWINVIEAGLDSPDFGTPSTSQWQTTDMCVERLLEDLDSYFVLRGRHIFGPLRKAFERDEAGHRKT